MTNFPGRRTLLDWSPKRGDRELIVVLYELPDNAYTPYATWAARKDSPEDTFWGHYHGTLEDAQRDFEKRSFGV